LGTTKGVCEVNEVSGVKAGRLVRRRRVRLEQSVNPGS
jgi:hypothetical protein